MFHGFRDKPQARDRAVVVFNSSGGNEAFSINGTDFVKPPGQHL